MTIREMRASDMPAVTRLCEQLGYPVKEEAMVQRFAALTGRRGEQLLVAVQRESVCGWVHVRRVNSLESEPHAEIWGLVVDDGERSHGIGRDLLATAERWATGQGLSLVRVRSNVTRARAHAFYEREGYTIVKRQAVFEKRLT